MTNTSTSRTERRRPDRMAGRAALRQIFAALAVAFVGAVPAAAQTQGVMQSRTNTLPRGAIFMADANGGHWWVSDQALGLCELIPQNVNGQPPFAVQNCNGTAKSGGQIVAGNPAASLGLPAGSKFLYVADSSTTSVKVVRFVFSPAGNGSLGSNTQMTVTNVTSVGGGAGGGRATALALTPHNGVAANGGTQDLYVGYLKSGDVMRIEGVDAVALNNATPAVSKVGSTSDGKGVSAFVMFGNDLYLGEQGGFGVSSIADPSGITRVACNATAPCTAVTLNPNPSALAGGMATDWTPGTPTTGKAIYIGNAPLGGVQNDVLKYDPATGVTAIYSLNINPTYTEPNSSGVLTTWTTYVGPLGLGFNPATGDLLVGDDPQFTAAVPVLQQGHFWKVPRPVVAVVPAVTSISPTSGTTLGGTRVTVTGTNLATYDATGKPTVLPSIAFGATNGTGVQCANTTTPVANPPAGTCTVTSPIGNGVVDVRVTLAGQTSPVTLADQYTFVAPATNAVAITGIAPNSGASSGGTVVTISGQNLATYNQATGAVTALPVIHFGANLATNVGCLATVPNAVAPIASTCTATSPAAAAAGPVDVQATINAQTSAAVPADVFTYFVPTANFFAWGITAPKGGATWIPGALGGHWWSSDHAQGLCRQDPMSTAPAQFAVPGSTLDAITFSVCASDLVGSAGQAVYDARPVVDLATGTATTFHYVYVPDNAVKSTAVWRLTFDPATETMVADPNGGAFATAMAPLVDQRTLKPNGMALGPDGNLYVADLVDPYVRQLTNPNGDTRTQGVQVVAQTGDSRGANGTQGFVGNYLYVSGNRATQFFDITVCPGVGNTAPGPLTGTPCGMASVPAPVGVFIAGTMTDPAHKRVYLSNSAGGGPAAIYRYDASQDVYVKFLAGFYPPDAFGVVHCLACTFGPEAVPYISGGNLPVPGTANGTVTAALTLQRPWDQTNHSTAGLLPGQVVPTTFSFVFGLGMDPLGNLAITEDPSAGARSGRGTMWIVPFLQ